nr:hypothetical protein [Anaerolineae bacterium]
MQIQLIYRQKLAWKYTAVVLLAVSLLIVACGGSGDTGPVETDEPPPTAEPTDIPPTDTPLPPLGSMTFNNATTLPLCGIFWVPTDSLQWGFNLLEGEELADGDLFAIPDIRPRSYDFKLNDCDGYVIGWMTDVVIEEGQDRSLDVGVPVDYVILENTSSLTVCEVYFAPPGQRPYFRNMLDPDQTILPNTNMYIALGAGGWDMRVVACSGEELEDVVIVDGETEYTITD